MQPTVLNTAFEEGTDSLMSSGMDSNSRNGKSSLHYSDFISSMPHNVLNWKKDLGKGVFFCENSSKGKMGVEGNMDCVELETKPKEPCAEVVWVEPLVETLGIGKVVDVKGVGCTLGGGFVATSTVSFTQPRNLVRGGEPYRVGGCIVPKGEGCPSVQKVVFSTGIVEDRPLLRNALLVNFFGGKGNLVNQVTSVISFPETSRSEGSPGCAMSPEKNIIVKPIAGLEGQALTISVNVLEPLPSRTDGDATVS
jgi:hypothetical protein